jgi:anti-anti-sigma factor
VSELIDIQTKELPDTILLDVRGEADLGTAPVLRGAVMSAIASRRHVIVNIRNIDYIDMSGFHVLEAGHRAVDEDQKFVIIASTPRVDRIIDIIGFRKIVPVVESEESALRFVRTHPDANHGTPSRETP